MPAQAASLLDYVGQCVPFARAASGIQIYGDAWTWWGQADGKYQRGHEPRVGAVIVFAKTSRLPLGHVGVISRIVDSRVALITQANWSKIDGERGHAEQDVTLFDVSKDNDWSEVRVWYKDMDGLGSSTYPIYGFIYGNPDKAAPQLHRQASRLCRRADRRLRADLARSQTADFLVSVTPDSFRHPTSNKR